MKTNKKFEGKAHNYEPIERKLDILSDQAYISERLDDQLAWHKRKSIWNHRKYTFLKNVDTMIAALVPLSLGVGSVFETSGSMLNDTEVLLTRILSALSGVYLAISAGFFELEGYQDNYKNYKRLYKRLESEKFKYLSRAEPYDEEDAFPRLVFTVENELHRDVMNFFGIEEKEGKKKKSDQEPNQ